MVLPVDQLELVEASVGGLLAFAVLVAVRELRFCFCNKVFQSPTRQWIDQPKPQWWVSSLLKQFPNLNELKKSKDLSESLESVLDNALTPRETPVLARKLFEFFAV